MTVIPHPQVSSGVAPAVGLAVSAMISIQLAAALSRPEMAEIGAPALTWICMVAAAVILISLTRPQWRGRTRSAMPAALKLGAALAMMSAAFFAAVNRLPLGPVSTIAFLGPLSVVLIGARRARPQALGFALVDGVCVALILAPFASGIQGSWTVDPLGLDLHWSLLWAARFALC
jgi:inner membrane transporter RhtA